MFENILSPQTKNLLDRLGTSSLPKDSYLAGGTAIALQLGHRRSADLDFFTPTEFTEKQWEEKLKENLGFKLIKRDWQTLIGSIDNVKFSLFAYKYKLIEPKKVYGNMWLASLSDLAAMKLDTILGRGTKRDLIDIYFLSQRFSLKKLFGFYQKKYANFEERELMIKKALVFFDDADKDEMPDMILKISWDKIKKWLVEEIKQNP